LPIAHCVFPLVRLAVIIHYRHRRQKSSHFPSKKKKKKKTPQEETQGAIQKVERMTPEIVSRKAKSWHVPAEQECFG
jgi:hypothetical protein